MQAWISEKVWLSVVAFVAAAASFTTLPEVFGQTPNSSPGSIFRDCANCPEMVTIPSGHFMMGSSSEEIESEVENAPRSDALTIRQWSLRERPQHEVTIKQPFALAKFSITKGELATFIQDTGYSPAPGCVFYALQYHVSPQADWRLPDFFQTDREPVVCTNWQDAHAYIDWLNQKFKNTASSVGGGPYRLPSEAEWEYAARAGTQTPRWWGESIGRNNANCARCGSPWDQKQTAPVESFRSNTFGVSGALGNVWQWTEDCWNENYVNAPTDGTPWTTGICERRVSRGGDWASFPWLIRAASRTAFPSDRRYNTVGFRVAKTLQPEIR